MPGPLHFIHREPWDNWQEAISFHNPQRNELALAAQETNSFIIAAPRLPSSLNPSQLGGASL